MSLVLAARSLNACKFHGFSTVTFDLCMTALSVSVYPLVMTQFLQWPRIKIIQRNDFFSCDPWYSSCAVCYGGGHRKWKFQESGRSLSLPVWKIPFLFEVQKLGDKVTHVACSVWKNSRIWDL